jgi:DNA-binding CsgD family transcriptional regulator
MARQRLAGFGVTEREAEVLAAVTAQLRNREIASRLQVSVRTVESHVAALLRKLGAADRTALAEIGAQAGRADAALPTPLTSLVGREIDPDQITTVPGSLIWLLSGRDWSARRWRGLWVWSPSRDGPCATCCVRWPPGCAACCWSTSATT